MGIRPRRREGHDRGESLIELLVTIVILGITVPAIMGAVLLSVSTSSQDRLQVQAQAILTTWSETIARENKTDAAYSSCVSLAYYSTSPFGPGTTPNGLRPSVSAISYWDKATGTFVAGCAPATDPGIRRVQLKVIVDPGLLPGFEVSQTIIVRKLCLQC